MFILSYVTKPVSRSVAILLAIAMVVSCSGGDDDAISIDRSALIGTWTGNNYECLFDKPRDVKLVITKGPDPLGLKINLNDGEYVVDAEYGEDNEKKAFVGDIESSSYSVIISGLLYDDGILKLSVLLDEDICDATLTKQ